jgi:hypothetical protein
MKCPVSNCKLTTNRHRLNDSDLVLFHFRSRIDKLPTHRFQLQRWVYINYESPHHCPLCTRLNGYFNLSATYRSDSDFTSIYYSQLGMNWHSSPQEPSNKNIAKTKTNFGFALISNCESNTKRIQYINTLNGHLNRNSNRNIDQFGYCSGVYCKNDDDCKETLSINYKFYFAFENSYCQDYITEKFFDILKFNIVPVVMGGGEYENYVPKYFLILIQFNSIHFNFSIQFSFLFFVFVLYFRSSFINIKDYASPNDLAQYLIFLDQNDTEYNKYFKWKNNIWFDKKDDIIEQAYLCEMCIKLQLERYTGGVSSTQIKNHNELMGLKSNCKGVEVLKRINNDHLFHYNSNYSMKLFKYESI